MKKKVCVCDLKLEEILDRLDRGEKVYFESSITHEKTFYGKVRDYLVRYVDGKPASVGNFINFTNSYYFLDEEETEVDESCIGKLCAFWDNSESEDSLDHVGVLYSIDNNRVCPYSLHGGENYEFCRPLTTEEAKKFIKED